MNVFEALADPTRRGMLELLRGHERAAGELGAAFPALTQPAVSRHLRVLREAGLVTARASEQRRLYSLCPAGLAELEAWLARYRPFWVKQLDALEKHLDGQAGKKKTSKARNDRK